MPGDREKPRSATAGSAQGHLSAFRHLTEDGLPTGPVTNWARLESDTVQPGREFIGQSLANGGIVCAASVMLRSPLVADEQFCEADGPYADLALWLRVALRSDVGFLPDPLSGFLAHPGSASSGFHTVRQAGGRMKLTLDHANAVKRAHGRFVARPELDPPFAQELQDLLRSSDRRIRLSILANSALPPPALKLAKKVIGWGPGRPAYRALSLYSAYAPQPMERP